MILRIIYPQRTLVVKYKDNLFKSAMTSYTPQIAPARIEIFRMSIGFTAGTEYLRGRVPLHTQVRTLV